MGPTMKRKENVKLDSLTNGSIIDVSWKQLTSINGDINISNKSGIACGTVEESQMIKLQLK
jgi:hypothetical protein